LANIYQESELVKEATCAIFAQVQTEGNRQVTRDVEFYNLDAIISIGYRVNSQRATQFRQWATSILRDYAIRGYIIDRKRMENGTFPGEDYFEHLLAEDILFVEGLKYYVILQLDGQRIITRMILKSVQELLPADRFLRINRSYIVNRERIDSFDNNDVFIKSHEIAIGNFYRDSFFEGLMGKR
jgi:hypothetical protein